MSGPVSLWEIMSVLALGTLASIGGGAGQIAMIQAHWVASGVIDPVAFAWILALGWMTPGPLIGYVAAIGFHLRGLAGAVIAFTTVMVPAFIGSALTWHVYRRLRPLVQKISLPATFVVAGLITASAWGTAIPLQLSPREVLAAAGVTWLAGWQRIDPIWIVGGAVAVGLGMYLGA